MKHEDVIKELQTKREAVYHMIELEAYKQRMEYANASYSLDLIRRQQRCLAALDYAIHFLEEHSDERILDTRSQEYNSR